MLRGGAQAGGHGDARVRVLLDQLGVHAISRSAGTRPSARSRVTVAPGVPGGRAQPGRAVERAPLVRGQAERAGVHQEVRAAGEAARGEQVEQAQVLGDGALGAPPTAAAPVARAPPAPRSAAPAGRGPPPAAAHSPRYSIVTGSPAAASSPAATTASAASGPATYRRSRPRASGEPATSRSARRPVSPRAARTLRTPPSVRGGPASAREPRPRAAGPARPPRAPPLTCADGAAAAGAGAR